eukprot:m.563361 g.563361  ORF g.563361 m.563361 type:complete len:88 (+) comp22230_c0_seq13:1825-2088(+)
MCVGERSDGVMAYYAPVRGQKKGKWCARLHSGQQRPLCHERQCCRWPVWSMHHFETITAPVCPRAQRDGKLDEVEMLQQQIQQLDDY